MGDNVDFQRQRNKGGVGTKCRREVLFGRQKMERLSVKCVLFGNHLCFMHRRTALPQRLATLFAPDHYKQRSSHDFDFGSKLGQTIPCEDPI